jgi:hypothetical protein
MAMQVDDDIGLECNIDLDATLLQHADIPAPALGRGLRLKRLRCVAAPYKRRKRGTHQVLRFATHILKKIFFSPDTTGKRRCGTRVHSGPHATSLDVFKAQAVSGQLILASSQYGFMVGFQGFLMRRSI